MRPTSILVLAAALAAGAPAAAQQPTLLDQALGRLLGGRRTAGPQAATPGGPNASALQGASGRTAPVSTFDIAGIHLGDTGPQVRAVLAKGGYRIFSSYDQAGFEDRVQAAVAARRGVAIPIAKATVQGRMTVTGPNTIYMEMEFRVVPTGSVVSEIYWKIDQTAMTPQAFLAQVLAKYGPANGRVGSLDQLWCETHVESCNISGIAYKAAANLRSGTSGDNSLHLVIGTDADAVTEGVLAAEVDRRAPKLGRAPF